MELMQLKYFCEAARTQHITRSAEKLHIAQPALSMAIRRLEDELGVKLFAGRGRGIVLTDAGRYLYKRLEPLMETLETLPDDVRRIAQVEQATVRLNVLAASACVTDAVIAYRRQHGTRFRFIQNDAGDGEGLCDLSITTCLRHRHEEGAAEYIFTEPVLLAVPDEERFRGMDAISLDEVRGEDFVCLAGTRRFRTICDKYCAAEGFLPKVVFESDTPSTVHNLIASGCGIGFWPRFTWGRFRIMPPCVFCPSETAVPAISSSPTPLTPRNPPPSHASLPTIWKACGRNRILYKNSRLTAKTLTKPT